MSKDYVNKKLARRLQEKGYPLKKVYRQDGAPFFLRFATRPSRLVSM